MAITKRDVPIEHRGRSGRLWCINATSADAQGNEILLAAQTTKEGLKERIRIRDITINCAEPPRESHYLEHRYSLH